MPDIQPIIAAKERGPGPGRYFLPPTIGHETHDATRKTEPAYSFGRRSTYKEKKYGPGPAHAVDPAMTRNGKDGTPCYSMLARSVDPKEFNTPSPGRYYPEKVHPQRQKHAPKYSIGFRNTLRKVDQNPSPSKYLLPKVMGPEQPNKTSASSYSMTGRSMIGCYLEDLAAAPSPGHARDVHLDTYMNKAPHYSLGSRNYMPSFKIKKPGPGAHYPEHVTINKPQAPKPSLGVRHSEYTCPVVPDIYF